MNLLGASALTLLLALSGCSKQFQCHLSGTNCPASAAPAGGGGGGGGGGEESSESSGSGSSEEAPSSESSSSSESESAPAPGEKKDCLPSGVKTDNYHKCCSEAAKSQIEASEDIYTCA